MIADPTVELELARTLERAEATACANFVDARASVDPHVGATWIDVAGVYAMYDGPDSPMTQTFGLGLFHPFLSPEFDRVEEFFEARGAPTDHETSPFVSPATRALLPDRGYVPIESSVVLIRPTVVASQESTPRITVRRIRPDEGALWARVAAEGWGSESAELAAFVENIGRVSTRTRGTYCFLAELDNTPIAAGALNLSSEVALLAGASTIPAARKQGAQRALLETRLAFAAARGATLAMVVTAPDSASQRNAERSGFRPAYSRVKWRRPRGVA